MALQSSGQITLQDIATELGAGIANLSLASMSDTAGFGEPDAMTDFYGFGLYANTHYYIMSTAQALRRSSEGTAFVLNTTNDISFNFWIKQMPTAANETIFDLSNTASNTNNKFFLQYNKGLNRLTARVRTGSSNFDRQWSLHDNNSVTGTGTNSSTAWSNTNRGNTNSGGWTMLTVTYDASQTSAANAFKLYWNATEVTSTAVANSGSRTSANMIDLTIGNNNNNATDTAGGMNAAVDEFKIFTSALSSANVTTLYNSASAVNAANSYSTNLLTEFTFDSNTEDSAGVFPTSQTDSGSRTSY